MNPALGVHRFHFCFNHNLSLHLSAADDGVALLLV
jgi:hypothetical protein